MTKSLNRRHTMTKRSPIKLEALYSPNCLELDFGHLRANEIDTLLSPYCPRSADLSEPTPYYRPCDDTLVAPCRPTFPRTRHPSRPQVLFPLERLVFAGCRGRVTRRKSQGPS